MVPSGILVSITTGEHRGGLLVKIGLLVELYRTKALWLYVGQLDTQELS